MARELWLQEKITLENKGKEKITLSNASLSVSVLESSLSRECWADSLEFPGKSQRITFVSTAGKENEKEQSCMGVRETDLLGWRGFLGFFFGELAATFRQGRKQPAPVTRLVLSSSQILRIGLVLIHIVFWVLFVWQLLSMRDVFLSFYLFFFLGDFLFSLSWFLGAIGPLDPNGCRRVCLDLQSIVLYWMWFLKARSGPSYETDKMC